jgi:hypothetical protein
LELLVTLGTVVLTIDGTVDTVEGLVVVFRGEDWLPLTREGGASLGVGFIVGVVLGADLDEVIDGEAFTGEGSTNCFCWLTTDGTRFNTVVDVDCDVLGTTARACGAARGASLVLSNLIVGGAWGVTAV